MLKYSPIPVRVSKVRILNIESNPPYFCMESTDQNLTLFELSASCLGLFSVKMIDEVLKIMQQSTIRSVRFSKFYIVKISSSLTSQYWKTIDCNPWVLSSFVFEVILFAAHARVDALSSKKKSTTHPNFHTVKQNLESNLDQVESGVSWTKLRVSGLF